jgi:hypothetical protein
MAYASNKKILLRRIAITEACQINNNQENRCNYNYVWHIEPLETDSYKFKLNYRSIFNA